MKKRLLSAFVVLAMLASCFAGVVTVSAEDNLLSNGGFESALYGKDTDWGFTSTGNWYNEGTSSQTNTQHNSGSYSVKMNEASVGQRVTLYAGTKYTLTAYIKADVAVSYPVMGFYDGTKDYPMGDGCAVKTTSVSATAEWQKVTLDFDCTATQDYVVGFLVWKGTNTAADVYADDVTLTGVEGEYDGGGVVNGNFANGTTGWTVDGTTAAVTDGALVASGTVRVYQTVTDLEAGTYNLTATAFTSDIAEAGTSYLYAKTTGHTVASTAIPEATKDDSVYNIVVPSIVVGEDGTCDIGLNLESSASVTIDNLKLEPTESTRVKFYKGGEISKLTYVEDNSGVFKRADGTTADALQVMAENGFNLARIRLLDDPGPGHGQKNTDSSTPTGWYLPKGYMTEEDCLEMARRAKDKGMDILFSFAYSDYWVDGDKQMMPAAWKKEITDQGLSDEAMYQYLEDKTYSYTKKVMEDLAAQGTTPEFVSIGNEIQAGMYFGQRGTDNFYSALSGNAAMLKRFLKAGAKAVREVSPKTKIVFHSDNGGKLSERATFMSVIRDSSMSEYFDVIGVSYYPFYNKDNLTTKQKTSIDDVVSEFSSLVDELKKDVIIMETGYNWDELRGDGYEGQLQDSGYYQDTYGESKEGQRAFLTELYAKLKKVLGGRCIGDLYWDPVMIYDGGSYTIGWAVKEDDNWTDGNVVSNSTIFDFDGIAVPGQLAMKYNTESSDTLNISGKIKSGTTVAANKEVTFTVNGKQYNRTTDKYGDYIVSIPYPEDGKVSISLKGSGTPYTDKAAPTYEGILMSGIDFSDFVLTTDPDPDPDPDPEPDPDPDPLTALVDANGTISYETNLEKSAESDVLWVALYSGGRLIEVKQAKSGAFTHTAADGTEYTVKAMLWKESGEPVYADSETNVMLSAE